MTRFSIIGAGRVGTALGFALTRKGWDIEAIADRNPAAARESRKVIGRGRATTDIPLAARGVAVLFICVPDDAVAAVARALARSRADWSGRRVFHMSGLLPASALRPLRERGARVASLHPVGSFPTKGGSARFFRGIFWGIEGDEEAVRFGSRLARTLGGRSFVLAEKNKPLYHAACTLASNAFVALEDAAAELLHEAGVREKTAAAVLLPLVQGTLQNVKELGLKKAMTGPIVRGDVRTVRSHLEALKSRPCEEAIYRALGKRAVELLARGKIPPGKVRALRRLLEGRRPPLPAGRRTSRRRVP